MPLLREGHPIKQELVSEKVVADERPGLLAGNCNPLFLRHSRSCAVASNHRLEDLIRI